MSSTGSPVLGYYHGDDGYGLERAADAIVERLALAGPVERWRAGGDTISVGRLAERLGTGSLFGGGMVAIVTEPLPLVRSKEDRGLLVAALAQVAPGNGLVFLESTDGGRRPKALEDLAAAVGAAGGDVRALAAPRQGQLARWIEDRARERDIRLAPGAARELATRIGGFVREGDVDRRRQGELAVGELEKLALYRPDAPIGVDDVRALVAEVVPGSAWAFLDAVGLRRVGPALALFDRLGESTHELVLLVHLHRRIRELIQVADLLEHGARPAAIVAELKLKPFRAERLAEQARTWRLEELGAALDGLLELDALARGARGATAGPSAIRLGFSLWIADHVGRGGDRG